MITQCDGNPPRSIEHISARLRRNGDGRESENIDFLNTEKEIDSLTLSYSIFDDEFENELIFHIFFILFAFLGTLL